MLHEKHVLHGLTELQGENKFRSNRRRKKTGTLFMALYAGKKLKTKEIYFL